ncbi:Phosphoribosyltransferase [Macrophomina phaseolina MS6]|uniref:Phosphoribosyltransferase n=1 Tax=Macrophomina phaseolina (strain MS6) TaxID=1126212 RepID=K2RCB7_MACPH|nr:Phosphoribosyltransferase [Macrophomina phaseolina MS6]
MIPMAKQKKRNKQNMLCPSVSNQPKRNEKSRRRMMRISMDGFVVSCLCRCCCYGWRRRWSSGRRCVEWYVRRRGRDIVMIPQPAGHRFISAKSSEDRGSGDSLRRRSCRSSRCTGRWRRSRCCSCCWVRKKEHSCQPLCAVTLSHKRRAELSKMGEIRGSVVTRGRGKYQGDILRMGCLKTGVLVQRLFYLKVDVIRRLDECR